MPADPNFKLSKRYLFIAFILLLTLYIVIPQIDQFKSSITTLTHPEPGWTVLAVFFTLMTYVAGAGTYCLLAFKKLSYSITLLVQFAAMFINRLLPGGIGALGANFVYLKRQRHSSAQAASVVAINNVLGGLGHYLLLGLVLLITGYSTIKANQTNTSFGSNMKFVWIGLAILVIIGLIVGRKRFKKGLTELKTQLLEYRHRPGRVTLALITSICLTSFNVLALFACANALGVHLNFAIIMLVFTLGIGAGTATPTPGGLGGFEAGLVAGFVSFKVDSSTALAIALLYRLISYWLTLFAGAIAFVAAQRKQYL
jgi:uncharacterized membrane protein YbhN (UPF0104 family)